MLFNVWNCKGFKLLNLVLKLQLFKYLKCMAKQQLGIASGALKYVISIIRNLLLPLQRHGPAYILYFQICLPTLCKCFAYSQVIAVVDVQTDWKKFSFLKNINLKVLLHDIPRNNWETLTKVSVSAKLFIAWNYACKNPLHDHQYHIFRLRVEIPVAGAKGYELCFQH